MARRPLLDEGAPPERLRDAVLEVALAGARGLFGFDVAGALAGEVGNLQGLFTAGYVPPRPTP